MEKRNRQRRPGRPYLDQVAQGERQALILTAARGLFEQRGYAAVSIADVAAAVGITNAAVHYYFATKADLYAAVMRGVLEGIVTGIRRMAEAPAPVPEVLGHLATYTVMSLQTNAELESMMRDAGEHLSAEQQDEINRAYDGVMAALTDLMRTGIERGELAPADPSLLANAFWHMMSGFAGRSGARQGFRGRPDVAEALITLFLSGAGRSEKGHFTS